MLRIALEAGYRGPQQLRGIGLARLRSAQQAQFCARLSEAQRTLPQTRRHDRNRFRQALLGFVRLALLPIETAQSNRRLGEFDTPGPESGLPLPPGVGEVPLSLGHFSL